MYREWPQRTKIPLNGMEFGCGNFRRRLEKLVDLKSFKKLLTIALRVAVEFRNAGHVTLMYPG
jgi:hypothetical protein